MALLLFDGEYIKKAERDLSKNDIKAAVKIYYDNPSHLAYARMTVEWSMAGKRAGYAMVTFNTDSGLAQAPDLFFYEEFRRRGLYTKYVDHAIREWPKRGITKIVTGYFDATTKAILQTGGFTDPKDSLDSFSIDLESQEAKDVRAKVANGVEPEWRAGLKQEISDRIRVNEQG